jgi:4-hydroxy-3-methylbut-2-en-1-yl diphosphate synthase IspG/GcpE
MLDEDGNGRVTFSEFQALVQACASTEQASRQRVRVGSAEADIMRRLVSRGSEHRMRSDLKHFFLGKESGVCRSECSEKAGKWEL